MSLHLRPPTLADMQRAREWRNHPDVRPGLRTPFMLTSEQQEWWYREVVCDRRAPSRWWAVYDGEEHVGVTGLEGIQWENRLAEISLLIDPARAGQGYGRQAVRLVLEEAFERMGLLTVTGECYESNPVGIAFWRRVVEEYGGEVTTLPRRKWWSGRLWDAMWFTLTAEAWGERRKGAA